MEILTETEQKKLANGELLPLMEEFYTIQGEGFNSGKPAYFIRTKKLQRIVSWLARL